MFVFTAASVFIIFFLYYFHSTEVANALSALYLGMSLFTFTAYAFDKSAAKYGKQRIRERTLHLLALFCGWPGAAAAQQIFRHKTLKKQFRSVFLITAFINTAVLSFFTIPGLLEKTADFMEKYLKTLLNSI